MALTPNYLREFLQREITKEYAQRDSAEYIQNNIERFIAFCIRNGFIKGEEG